MCVTKFFRIFLLLFLFSKFCFSQNINIETLLSDSVIEKDASFTIKFIINGNFNNIELPNFKFDNFNIKDSNNVYDTLNILKVVQYSYTLKPNKIGVFNILQFGFTIDNHILKSKQLKIKVIKKSKSISKSDLDDFFNSPSTSVVKDTNMETKKLNDENSKQVFLQIEVNKLKACINEEIKANYYLYTLNSIEIINYSTPELSNFIIKDITDKVKINEYEKVKYNGKGYLRYLLYSYIIYPTTINSTKLNAFTLDANAQLETNGNSNTINNSFAKMFKMKSLEYKKVSLKSNDVNLLIYNFSNPAPVNFKGLVGNYQLETFVNNSKLFTNESINLKIKIVGSGNIQNLNNLDCNNSYDWDIGEPIITDTNYFINKKYISEKTFSYQISTNHFGSILLPTFALTYFNCNTNNYIVLESTNYTLQVAKGNLYQSNLNTNKLYNIAVVNTLQNQNKFFIYNNRMYRCFCLLPLLFIFTSFSYKQYIQISAKQMKKNNAKTIANAHLHKANEYLLSNNTNEFYLEIYNALWFYIQEKFKLPFSKLSNESLNIKLIENNVDEIHINHINYINNQCQQNLFGKNNNLNEANDIYNKACELILYFEKKHIFK